MPVEPNNVSGIDEKLLNEIIERHKLWSNVNHVSEEALILAPRDRKVLLDMIERLLQQKLSQVAENLELRTRLVRKISHIAKLHHALKLTRTQRDFARRLVQTAIDRVSPLGWPQNILENTKAALAAWEKEKDQNLEGGEQEE